MSQEHIDQWNWFDAHVSLDALELTIRHTEEDLAKERYLSKTLFDALSGVVQSYEGTYSVRNVRLYPQLGSPISIAKAAIEKYQKEQV